MTKAEADFHAADIASTPTGGGQNDLVASVSPAPKTADLPNPHSGKSAFLCRQNTPRACHRARPKINAAFKTATTFSKPPYIAD
jgi:hypothetical protein